MPGYALAIHCWASDPPAQPVPIYVSAFGPVALKLAARIADGYTTVMPEKSLVDTYRDAGGRGPIQGGFKVCHAPTVEEGVHTAHRLWANEQVPGELAQILPTPKHFMQASTLVTKEMIGDSVPCGPEPGPILDRVKSFADANFDEVHVQQIGPDQEAFFAFWADKIAPELP